MEKNIKEKLLTQGEREETEALAIEAPKDDAPLCKILLTVNLAMICYTGL